jgi:hypothetical protein
MTTTDPITAAELLAEVDQVLDASPLPSHADVVHSAESTLARALMILDLPVDPATEPTVVAAPFGDRVVDFLLAEVRQGIEFALRKLAQIDELPTPARQSDQSSAAVGLNAIATPGGPGNTPHWHDLVKPS